MIFDYKQVHDTTDIQVLNAKSTHAASFTIERLLICNTDNEDITVNLYLDNDVNTYYLLYNTTIPAGTTLDFLNGVPMVYDSTYSLKFVHAAGTYRANIVTNIY